jgi:hypothetical protein
MSEVLISKKDLLTETGISYGQLYRWKRKNIIPEEWFIKKSVPSGQETFFPREKILERIDFILNMKEEVSLDDLANMFSTDMEKEDLNIEKLLRRKVISERSIELYKNILKKPLLESLEEIVGIRILEKCVISGKTTLEEGKDLILFLNNHYENLKEEEARIYLFRHMGVSFVIGTKDLKSLFVNPQYKKIVEVNVYDEIGEIRLELMS